MSEKSVSRQTLQRLPLYLSYLKSLREDRPPNISSAVIAKDLELNSVQVRKDLAQVSSRGKPKLGYVTSELIKDIETFLGYNNLTDAVLVGAGKLGGALLAYKGFAEYGLNIVAAFDNNESVIGKKIGNTTVFPISKMENLCKRLNVKIAIITVPDFAAQETCDRLVTSGILAIWNFVPIHLKVPENILVQQENMASSLAVLSSHLKV